MRKKKRTILFIYRQDYFFAIFFNNIKIEVSKFGSYAILKLIKISSFFQ